jgi:heme-degrading monooxygenase HmoA
MSFVPALENEFIEVFNKYKDQIVHFPGCRSLKLLKENGNECVYFTFSVWANESNLEAYRKSELFKEVWSQTRSRFADKPMAWSTVIADDVK